MSPVEKETYSQRGVTGHRGQRKENPEKKSLEVGKIKAGVRSGAAIEGIQGQQV